MAGFRARPGGPGSARRDIRIDFDELFGSFFGGGSGRMPDATRPYRATRGPNRAARGSQPVSLDGLMSTVTRVGSFHETPARRSPRTYTVRYGQCSFALAMLKARSAPADLIPAGQGRTAGLNYCVAPEMELSSAVVSGPTSPAGSCRRSVQPFAR